MDDAELAAIRKRRLEQLKAQHQDANNTMPMSGAAESGSKGDEERESQREEMRRNLLVQILDNEARERLGRIQIVKPEKAREVEDLLIRMAQSGQLRSKLAEKDLISLLGQISQQQQSSTPQVVIRRRQSDSDDDDDYDL